MAVTGEAPRARRLEGSLVRALSFAPSFLFAHVFSPLPPCLSLVGGKERRCTTYSPAFQFPGKSTFPGWGLVQFC